MTQILTKRGKFFAMMADTSRHGKVWNLVGSYETETSAMNFARRLLPAAVLVLALGAGQEAEAFEASMPPMTKANPGGVADPTTVNPDRYKKKVPEKAEPKKKPRKKVQSRRPTTTACSADSLPAAERRRLMAEGARIERRHGRAVAYQWARKKGQEYRKRLQRQGICP